MTNEARPIKWIVAPPGESIFSELAANIEILDEGAGEFVEVTQYADECGKIRIDKDEWENIKNAIDFAFSNCKD